MVATPSVNPTMVPTFGVNILREVLAELQAQEPERGCRWDRAATIVAIRRIERSPAGAWWVESECEPGKEYWVCQPLGHVWTCTCQDFQRRGGPCKHALAVRLLQACETREGGSPPPALLAFPTRYYSDSDRFELTPLGEAVLEATAPTPAA